MGIAAADLRGMSLWEFHAMRIGWVNANNPPSDDGPGAALTDSEFSRLSAFIDTVH